MRREPAYTAVDARYACAITRSLELAVIGNNIFDAAHREWGDKTVSAEISRMVS